MTAHRIRLVVAGATALASLTGVAVWSVSDSGCESQLRLSVAAAPEIAPAVRDAGRHWVRRRPRVGDACVRLAVTPVDPARVAAAYAQDIGADLDVAGAEPVAGSLPDVWIPDSSSWLARLRAIDRSAVPARIRSIGMSPVVLALPEPQARAEGWPAEPIGWEHLLAGMRGNPPLEVATIEPRRSAIGLSSLLLTGRLANSTAKTAGQNPETAVLGTYRSLAARRLDTPHQLIDELPRLGAAVLPERTVRRYDETNPAVRLAAIYPEPAAPPLDYPYATLADLSSGESRAAALFQSWLLSRASRRVLTRHGFRTPDGSIGPDFPPGHGVSAQPVPRPREIPPDAVSTALDLWTEVSLPSRVLAVLDVSGSMASPVPSAGGISRLEVTRRAATAGLGMFTDDSDVGLWVFATGLNGRHDHRELAPVDSLADNRSRLAARLRGVQAVPGGGTGLYDTIRASYAHMVKHYDPDKANTIVVMTDGRNDDPNGITEARLRAEMERLSDPAKPVRLIVIGIGKDVDEHDLDVVVKATGGKVFLAPDPSKIREIFLRALALPSG